MAAPLPMAAFRVVKTLNVVRTNKFYANTNPNPTRAINPVKFRRSTALRSSSSSSRVMEQFKESEESMSTDALHRFIKLNLGNWNGTLCQFDGFGNLLQQVTSRLLMSSYGEDEFISLIQTLYIKQPASGASISGYDDEAEWTEYKIKETNMFTVDKYQQRSKISVPEAFYCL